MTILQFQIYYFLLNLATPSVQVSVSLVLSQALLESNKFASNLSQTYNNMFGMMYPQVRKTVATGKTAQGFAIYRSKWDCLRDYFLYLSQLELTTDAKLIAFFPRYATDKNYTAKVAAQQKAISGQIISPLEVLAKGVGLGLVAAGGVKLVKAATS